MPILSQIVRHQDSFCFKIIQKYILEGSLISDLDANGAVDASLYEEFIVFMSSKLHQKLPPKT